MNFKNLFTDSQKMFSIVVDGFDDRSPSFSKL